MLPALLLLIQDKPDLDAAMARYREMTRAETPCRSAASDDEIVVCARREADRYRPPLVATYAGRDAPEVRVGRLLDTAQAPCGEGAFTVKCGFAGVSVTVGREGVSYVGRPLAP